MLLHDGIYTRILHYSCIEDLVIRSSYSNHVVQRNIYKKLELNCLSILYVVRSVFKVDVFEVDTQ